jgi:hypothetical protein
VKDPEEDGSSQVEEMPCNVRLIKRRERVLSRYAACASDWTGGVKKREESTGPLQQAQKEEITKPEAAAPKNVDPPSGSSSSSVVQKAYPAGIVKRAQFG